MAILILYASAGNGHRRAAQGLYEAFIASGRSDVVMMDILDFTPMWFKQVYSSGYMRVINKAKWLWRFLFDLTNRPSHSIFVDSWHGLLNIMAAKSLGEYIKQANIDLVVTTHFMANDVVTYYRKKFSCKCRLVCVVTDYVVHRFWYSKGVDKYFVGCEDAKQQLVGMGILGEKISVTGIPVPASFLKSMPRAQLLERFGLEDKFTVLMLANAVRKEIIIDAVKVLMRDTQIVVGCGKNVALRREIEAFQDISNNLKTFGMIENMEYMMSLADVLVTKPGGLVVSEAIMKALPMILVDPIPGQEEGNRDFLVKRGVALYADSSVDLIRNILKLKRDSEALMAMKSAFEKMPSGDISGRIVEELLTGV